MPRTGRMSSIHRAGGTSAEKVYDTYYDSQLEARDQAWGLTKSEREVDDLLADKNSDLKSAKEKADALLAQRKAEHARHPTRQTKLGLQLAEERAQAANATYERRTAERGVESKRAADAKSREDYGLKFNVTDDMYKVAPELMGESARAGVDADPRAMQAQNKALDELFGIYSNGGATAQERARMARTRSDQDQYLRSQRESQQQDLSERGMLGSGAEIAMALGDRQNAGTRMAQNDLDTEAMLQDRALGALMQGTNVAGQIRGSSFNEGMARNTAKDEFAAMNNQIINGAKSNNTDFLRRAKEDLEQRKFVSNEAQRKEKIGIAGDLVGFDSEENRTGWASGASTAAADAGIARDTSQGRMDDYKDTHDPTLADGSRAIRDGTQNDVDAANTVADGKALEGVGQIYDSTVGAAAGGASSSSIGGFGGPPDDEEDD